MCCPINDCHFLSNTLLLLLEELYHLDNITWEVSLNLTFCNCLSTLIFQHIGRHVHPASHVTFNL